MTKAKLPVSSGTILIADSEPAYRSMLSSILKDNGYSTSVADSRPAVIQKLQSTSKPALLIADSELNLNQFAQVAHVKILTLHTRESAAHQASARRFGVSGSLRRSPLDVVVLLELVKSCEVGARSAVAKNAMADDKTRNFGLVGECAAMRAVREKIQLVGKADVSVLITGETGTGKELVARAVHEVDGRGPFVVVNCSAIPEGLLESELFGHVRGAFTSAVHEKPGLLETAGEGTLLLDEIGELALGLQAKLLRVLEQRVMRRVGGVADVPVRCRILASTNCELEKMMAEGEFRKDLFYRLSAFRIHMPPLRERGADIELLARHFGAGPGFMRTKELRAAAATGFPGNVRQLRNLIDLSLVMAGRTPSSSDCLAAATA